MLLRLRRLRIVPQLRLRNGAPRLVVLAGPVCALSANANVATICFQRMALRKPGTCRSRGVGEDSRKRLTERDCQTIRRLLREGGPKPRAQREVSSKLNPYRQYLLGRMLGEDSRDAAEKPDRIFCAHARHLLRRLLRSSLRVCRIRSLRCSAPPCS
jgi:hypothetical protein